MTKKETTRPRRSAPKKAEGSSEISKAAIEPEVLETRPAIEDEKEQAMPMPVRSTGAKTSRQQPTALRWTLFILVVLLMLGVGALAVFSIGIYRLGWHNNVVKRVVTAVPFPVAFADKTSIPYHDYLDDVQTLNYYFDHNQNVTGQGQTKPIADEITATVINRLIYDSVVNRLVDQYHIQISDAELQDQLKAIADSGGSGTDVAALLKSLYGWNETQFKQKVLRPYVALQKLDALLSQNGTLNGDAEQRANAILTKVKEGKTSFADLAKQYSEDTTASVGGDLGFFGKGEMDPDFEKALDALKPGETSGLVKTQYGYHIIKLVSKVDDPTKGVQYQASHILIKTKTIDDYVNDQIAKENVRILLRGFSWDKTNHWVVSANEAAAS